MPNDFISREAAIKTLRKAEALYRKCMVSQVRAEMIDLCIKLVNDVPAADVRPVVKASWILPNADGTDRPMAECSNCGWYVTSGGVRDFTFCPNCGADMRGLQK